MVKVHFSFSKLRKPPFLLKMSQKNVKFQNIFLPWHPLRRPWLPDWPFFGIWLFFGMVVCPKIFLLAFLKIIPYFKTKLSAKTPFLLFSDLRLPCVRVDLRREREAVWVCVIMLAASCRPCRQIRCVCAQSRRHGVAMVGSVHQTKFQTPLIEI